MKTITNNLSRVILAIVAVALIVGVVLAFAAPIGGFFSGTIGKLNEVGNGDMWELGNYGNGESDNPELIYYNVSLMAAPANGGTATFTGTNAGLTTMSLTGEKTVGLSAQESDGYYFQGWYSGDSATLLSVNRSYAPTVASETSLIASYAKAGLYDGNGNLLADWDTLVNTYGFRVDFDFDTNTCTSDPASFGYIVENNAALANGTRLVIPEGVTSIGSYAFNCCKTLTDISVPDSVSTVGKRAFAASALESMVFGEDSQLTEIAEFCFYSCKNLQYVSLPDGITSIGRAAFGECTSLTSVGSIGSNASVEWPEHITIISDRAFENCYNISSVEIPTYVTSIGASAFAVCTSLTEIYIPANVESIGRLAFQAGNAFGRRAEVQSIRVDPNNPVFHSENNCLIETASKTLILGCQYSVIPTDGSVTAIGESAFGHCANLTSIEIPASVTTIDSAAFAYCQDLTSVTFGENSQLTTIGDQAFRNSVYLYSIEIPAGVTTIGKSAFLSCKNLESITINSATMVAHNGSLKSSDELEAIYVPANLVSSYKAADGWSEFANLIQAIQ